MAEDWRVTFEIAGAAGGRLLRALPEHEVEHDAHERLGGRVAVSGDSSHVFLYADTEAAAREAGLVVSKLLKAHDLEAGAMAVDHWHPLEERWEDAKVAMPTSAADRKREHERWEAEETAESQASGLAAWEVRIEFASHHDAVAFATRLAGEEVSLVRRWKFLVVGTNDEDDARALARLLERDLPAGALLHVEPGGGAAWQAMPKNPFAVFGGLAG